MLAQTIIQDSFLSHPSFGIELGMFGTSQKFESSLELH